MRGYSGKNSNLKGIHAEALAGKFLRQRGYGILESNFRRKTGEIDLIAEKDGRIHFVEVRYRSRSDFGTPAETVSRGKLARIRNTALLYLQYKGRNHSPAQIDVIAITADEIHWIQNVM